LVLIGLTKLLLLDLDVVLFHIDLALALDDVFFLIDNDVLLDLDVVDFPDNLLLDLLASTSIHADINVKRLKVTSGFSQRLGASLHVLRLTTVKVFGQILA
jgi:hypothetical protein